MNNNPLIILRVLLALILLALIILLIVIYNVSPKIQVWSDKILKREGSSPTNEALQLWLKTVLNKYAPSALIGFNVYDEILSWNRGAEIMFGRSAEEMDHKKLLEIIPKKYHKEHLDWLTTYREAEITQTESRLYRTALRANGEEFSVVLNFYLDKSFPGLDLFVVVIQDLTEIEILKAKARCEVEKLEQYERIAGIGGWYWELAHNDDVVISKGYSILFDIDYGKKYTSADMMKLVHKDDKDHVNNVIAQAFAEKTDYEVFYRITNRSREEIKIHCKAEAVFYNEDLIGFNGTVKKI